MERSGSPDVEGLPTLAFEGHLTLTKNIPYLKMCCLRNITLSLTLINKSQAAGCVDRKFIAVIPSSGQQG